MPVTIKTKQHLYAHCQHYLQKRIDSAQAEIGAIQQSANEESKSSVGDKYETGRAMMQLEIEKLSAQLAESLKLKKILDSIKPDEVYSRAVQGSLIITNNGNFYLTISAGQFTIDGATYIALSPASPLGQKLLGCKANDTFLFHNKKFHIIDLC
jgi:transcription elongation GreA/GreB family factor